MMLNTIQVMYGVIAPAHADMALQCRCVKRAAEIIEGEIKHIPDLMMGFEKAIVPIEKLAIATAYGRAYLALLNGNRTMIDALNATHKDAIDKFFDLDIIEGMVEVYNSGEKVM